MNIAHEYDKNTVLYIHSLESSAWLKTIRYYYGAEIVIEKGFFELRNKLGSNCLKKNRERISCVKSACVNIGHIVKN